MTAVAVVVTHNRLGLLRACLQAVLEQTRPPDAVVVVDNASSDGTAAYLAELRRAIWPPLHVLGLDDNRGGAGGFAAGVEAALRLQPDWLWLMDDDCLPEAQALDRLLAAAPANVRCAEQAGADLGYLASAVVWTDGAANRMNAPGRFTRGRRGGVTKGSCQHQQIDYASFVSMLISSAAVRACGLPIAEFFLGSDDVEYSWRLSRAGYCGFFVPESRVVHLTRSNDGFRLWQPDVTLADPHALTCKVRNLVAVNRRRRFGWLREGVRVVLLPLVWRLNGVDAHWRRLLTKAARDGLFWRYERYIRHVE